MRFCSSGLVVVERFYFWHCRDFLPGRMDYIPSTSKGILNHEKNATVSLHQADPCKMNNIISPLPTPSWKVTEPFWPSGQENSGSGFEIAYMYDRTRSKSSTWQLKKIIFHQFKLPYRLQNVNEHWSKHSPFKEKVWFWKFITKWKYNEKRISLPIAPY